MHYSKSIRASHHVNWHLRCRLNCALRALKRTHFLLRGFAIKAQGCMHYIFSAPETGAGLGSFPSNVFRVFSLE